jgi:excisionase family DNA binding protein
MILEELFTADELSKHLLVNKQTIYNWVAKKKVPYIKLGGKLIRFKMSHVKDWLLKNRCPCDCHKIVHNMIMKGEFHGKPK